jgi:signal transduction histidine kinase
VWTRKRWLPLHFRNWLTTRRVPPGFWRCIAATRHRQPRDNSGQPPGSEVTYLPLRAVHQSGGRRALTSRLPVWRLATWGAALACVVGVPLGAAVAYAWWTQPGSPVTLVLSACALLIAAGCVGAWLLLRAVASGIRGISIAGLSTAPQRHPIREIGEVIRTNQAGTRTLRAVHASVLHAEESERRRLARELHDELGQELALLHMWLTTARKDEIDHASRSKVLDECEALAGTLLEQVRSMALDLRPAQLDDLGLPAALRMLARRVGKQAGITATLLAIPPSVPRFPEDIETAMFRIVQAAVTNAVRHAGASTLWIALEVQDGEATVKVQDDGSGFDLDAVSVKAGLGLGGMGLRVMQERVQALGGRIEFITAPGTGTLVKASFPVEAMEVA